MAYSSANLLRMTGSLGGGGVLYSTWVYKSADTFTTVKASNYITDALTQGMQIGDTIIVVDTATPAQTIAMIVTVGASGATMSQTGVVPST